MTNLDQLSQHVNRLAASLNRARHSANPNAIVPHARRILSALAAEADCLNAALIIGETWDIATEPGPVEAEAKRA